jgi:hypothetical protein
VERSRRALAEIRYAETSVIRSEAIASREAFDLAAAGQTRAAADRMQQVINSLEDPATRGWLTEQKAAYLHLTDPVAAQQLLAAAVRENAFVLRPSAGIAPDAESKIGRSVGRRQHPAERQRSRIRVFWWQGSGGVGEGDFLAGEAF